MIQNNFKVGSVGKDWLLDEVANITDEIEYIGPVDFVEKHRYLSNSVTSQPGPMSYDVNPYMREILECFSMRSPVREVTLLKGVQLTYTVGLIESVLLYFIAYLKIYPGILATADAELVKIRMENNIIPMLEHSGFKDIIRSSDAGNARKTGMTKNLVQWEGGGSLLPLGVQNANKLRSNSALFVLDDEMDGWPQIVGKDGCPVALLDDRTAAYTDQRKILRGSTPLLKHNSKTYRAYMDGDRRKYFVVCRKCGFAQFLEWRGKTEEGKTYGIDFETEKGVLVRESVRYLCHNCQAEYFEEDKEYLFHAENGAEWRPTAQSKDPHIRSYHLPAMYSPIGFMSWTDCVRRFLEAWDNENNAIIDIGKYRRFVNNVKGWPFEVIGDRVRFSHVSSHRRKDYHLGEVPNDLAIAYSGSKILILICTVDVQEKYLSVSVTGVARGGRTYLIEYLEIEGDDCKEITDKSWGGLAQLIEGVGYTDGEGKIHGAYKDIEGEMCGGYRADDGNDYGVYATFIDSGYAPDTVRGFCDQYSSMVFSIMGRADIGKNPSTKEFNEFQTKGGNYGFYIKVDLYKERLAPVLRRIWNDSMGEQPRYHFNAPVDISDKALGELTVEYRRSKEDARGNITYEWHRPSGSHNELWDLLVYAHAGVEILAYITCIIQHKMDKVDWVAFWDLLEEKLKVGLDKPAE